MRQLKTKYERLIDLLKARLSKKEMDAVFEMEGE